MRQVKVKFRRSGKRFWFDAGEFELKQGDPVVVQLEKGVTLGTVVGAVEQIDAPREGDALRPVLRQATPEDVKRAERLRLRGREAFEYCLKRINERHLPMKLVDAEFLLDESRATFYFTAEGRVDFRELVRDLAHQFRTRIEMMQIGVRDESKILGGHGICGRELCCASWLVKFNPVSIRMAKDQSLSLNPTKVSGVCGRLMCCLSYEHEQYLELVSGLPRLGKRYQCAEGPCRISRIDVLSQRVFATIEGGGEIEISGQEVQPYNAGAGRASAEPEPEPEPAEQPVEAPPDEAAAELPPDDTPIPDQDEPDEPTEPAAPEGGAQPEDGQQRSRRPRRRRRRRGGAKPQPPTPSE